MGRNGQGEPALSIVRSDSSPLLSLVYCSGYLVFIEVVAVLCPLRVNSGVKESRTKESLNIIR